MIENVLKLVPKDRKVDTEAYSSWLRALADDVDSGKLSFTDVLIVYVNKEDRIAYLTANTIRRHVAMGLLTLAVNKIATE